MIKNIIIGVLLFIIVAYIVIGLSTSTFGWPDGGIVVQDVSTEEVTNQ